MASCSTKPRRLRRLVLSERVRPSRVPRVPNRQRASVPDCASDAHPESPSPAFRDLRTFSLASHPLDCRSARSLGTLRHPSSYGSPSLAVGHFCHLPQSIEATNRALVSASRGLPLAQAERGHPMVLVSEAGSRFRREYPFEIRRQSVRPASRTCHRRKPQPPDEQQAGLFRKPSLVTLTGRPLLGSR